MSRVLVFLLISIFLSRWFWRLVASFMEGLRGESAGKTAPPLSLLTAAVPPNSEGPLKTAMEKMCGRFSDVYAGDICWSPEDHQGNKIGAWIRMEKGKVANIGAKWVPPGR